MRLLWCVVVRVDCYCCGQCSAVVDGASGRPCSPTASLAQIQDSAAAAGASPQAFCDSISATFRHAFSVFNISHTDFVRTTEARHKQVSVTPPRTPSSSVGPVTLCCLTPSRRSTCTHACTRILHPRSPRALLLPSGSVEDVGQACGEGPGVPGQGMALLL